MKQETFWGEQELESAFSFVVREYGGEFTEDEWILTARGETEIAAVFDTLRNHGVLFGGAPGG